MERRASPPGPPQAFFWPGEDARRSIVDSSPDECDAAPSEPSDSGVNPQRVYSYEYRRRLPHLQPDFKIIFTTFCTYLRWTLPPAARTIVVDTCVAGNGLKFDLYGLVVMPDHVHLALAPIYLPQGPVPVPEIMQAIKGASAHRIDKLLNRRGKVWQEESFDRALRKEEQVQEKLLYMLENPVRAGLVRNPLDYPWIWRRTSPMVISTAS